MKITGNYEVETPEEIADVVKSLITAVEDEKRFPVILQILRAMQFVLSDMIIELDAAKKDQRMPDFKNKLN